MRSLAWVVLGLSVWSSAASAESALQPAVIQSVELSAARAYYVPTHPRVTTTIRFPQEIGAPEGAIGVFTEDAGKQPAEYLVTWQQGDAYFTVTPLKDPQMANLNVPCAGQTFVFYFYPVADQLKALACVNLLTPTGAAIPSTGSTTPNVPPSAVIRQNTAPDNSFLALSPARLVGMLDRLKLIHATAAGPALAELAQAMNVEVASSSEDNAVQSNRSAGPPRPGAAPIASGLNDAGLYQIILLRAVRDPRLNCIGFICLIRNTSNQALAFDVNSFGARAGAEYLTQRVSDATPILKPGEQSPAYFVVMAARNSPLRAANDWRISVDLVSPRTNPGSGITRAFSPDTAP